MRKNHVVVVVAVVVVIVVAVVDRGFDENLKKKNQQCSNGEIEN